MDGDGGGKGGGGRKGAVSSRFLTRLPGPVGPSLSASQRAARIQAVLILGRVSEDLSVFGLCKACCSPSEGCSPSEDSSRMRKGVRFPLRFDSGRRGEGPVRMMCFFFFGGNWSSRCKSK